MKVELNIGAIKNLLKSEEFAAAVYKEAKAHLPDGFEVKTERGFDRARAVVTPTTGKARNDALRNNTLEKAYSPIRVGHGVKKGR